MLAILFAFVLAMWLRAGEIIDLQDRIREIGRIRLGYTGRSREGKPIPKKLLKFRVTSVARDVVEAMANLFGGDVKPWDNNGRPEYEVYTDADVMPVYLPPPDMALTQFYEQWANGFCTRRCNGRFDTARDEPCDCDPEHRDCSIVSRVNVIVRDLHHLGTMRAESGGYYSAVGLKGTMSMIRAMGGSTSLVPAMLRIVPEERRRLIDGEAVVRKIPVLAVDLEMTALAAPPVTGVLGDGAPETAPASWKPVAALDQPAPAAPTIEAQIAEAEKPAPPKPRRANAQAPVPTTGRKPRTAAERAGGNGAVRHGTAPSVDTTDRCALCGEPYRGEPLLRNPTDRPGRYVHKSCAESRAGSGVEEVLIDLPATPHPGAEAGGRGRTNGEPVASTGNAPPTDATGDALPAPDTEPSPAATGPTRLGVKMPTAKMHSKIFALLREAMPVEPNSPDSPDDVRRSYEMELCEAVGAPGLTSHKQITYETGALLIDALEGVADQSLRFYRADGDQRPRLVRSETGEIVDFGAPFD